VAGVARLELACPDQPNCRADRRSCARPIASLAAHEGQNLTLHVNRACLQAHLAAEANHDLEATLATLHPECVFLDEPLGMRFDGRDGASEHYTMWWSAFGNTIDGGQLHWISDELVVGDSAFVGHHSGPFLGISASGRTIRLPFVVFVRFRDGLLAGERFVYDLNTLLRQLGEPAFAPEKWRS
jgi:steroid delta-isomerase-like uncharacterized protein